MRAAPFGLLGLRSLGGGICGTRHVGRQPPYRRTADRRFTLPERGRLLFRQVFDSVSDIVRHALRLGVLRTRHVPLAD